jgi:4,5-DOPA dioxygenase extradiol
MENPRNPEMPVLFIGHGSPENAIEDNEFTRSWKKVAGLIPKPSAILCISAHWIDGKTRITAGKEQKTIHDFYGFQEELYRIRYDAAGSPDLAIRVIKMIRNVKVQPDTGWGLDHGTWTVLKNMYPETDIPVLQLSIDYDLPFEKHLQIGKELCALRKEGVLIIGSGNLVHNLSEMRLGGKPFDWAVDFDLFVKKKLIEKDYAALTNFREQRSGIQAHPTYDHYIPLFYAVGAASGERPQFFNEKIVYGSVGMRSILYFGDKNVILP